jgi:hypothetical protein
MSVATRRRRLSYAAVGSLTAGIAAWDLGTHGSVIVASVMSATTVTLAVGAVRAQEVRQPPDRDGAMGVRLEGPLRQMGVLITSEWLPYRALLAYVASFLLLRYILAPGSTLVTDTALAALSLPVFLALSALGSRRERGDGGRELPR